MNLIKAIRRQLAADLGLNIIRADQPGDLPPLPYATYKVLGDGKGFGHYMPSLCSPIAMRTAGASLVVSIHHLLMQ